MEDSEPGPFTFFRLRSCFVAKRVDVDNVLMSWDDFDVAITTEIY